MAGQSRRALIAGDKKSAVRHTDSAFAYLAKYHIVFGQKTQDKIIYFFQLESDLQKDHIETIDKR